MYLILRNRRRSPDRRSLSLPCALALRLTSAIAVLMPNGVFAHIQTAGPHGGPVTESAGYHVELVGAGQQLSVYVANADGTPVASEGAAGKALIFRGSRTEAVALMAEGAFRLSGEVPRALGPGDLIVVTATLANGQAIQARFLRN